MAVLDREPGCDAPGLLWKASGNRLARSSGGETAVRGCAGLVGVGRSGNDSGRRPERPVDELAGPPSGQPPPPSPQTRAWERIIVCAYTRTTGGSI